MATTETRRETTPAPARRTHPPSQYWDHRTASWQTARPIPVPRRGE